MRPPTLLKVKSLVTQSGRSRGRKERYRDGSGRHVSQCLDDSTVLSMSQAK